MARQRITATELAKMFNSARQPIYVLDGELTVVFLNRACCDWLGEAAEGLLGSQCAYHSSPKSNGPNAVAAGLCPPPAALAAKDMTATVLLENEDGRELRRRVRFVPLGACADDFPEDLIALVAILDTEDLPEAAAAEAPLPAGDEPEAVHLHEQVRRFRREAAARYRAERLIGHSPAIRRVRSQLELAVGSRASVLLVGPAGSGRQHTAAAIHYGGSGHSPGSLIPLACSVLGAELIRSTVTALATKNPLGDEAAHSTLLLNEADRIPAEVQAELATLLLNRQFPFRVIATAELSLSELVGRGAYSVDLAATLSTLTMEFPALSDRREDISLLAQLFLEEANAAGGRQLGGFTPEALDALDAYSWPGNVDQLAQVVAQSHQRSAGPEIGIDDLPRRIHLAAQSAAYPPHREEQIVLDEFMARVERELIQRAMARAKGNKAKAARLLGMSRPRLYRRLVQLGLLKD